MTVNELIISTLSDTAPCYPWSIYDYDGDAHDARRIVFNYSIIPEYSADDLIIFDRYVIQVHYFCPITDDSVATRKSIRLLLQNAGFTRPDEVTVGTASDESAAEQHYCFECEYLEPVDYEEDE